MIGFAPRPLTFKVVAPVFAVVFLKRIVKPPVSTAVAT